MKRGPHRQAHYPLLRKANLASGWPGTLRSLNDEGKWPWGHESKEKEMRFFLQSGIKPTFVLARILASPYLAW